MSTQEMSVAKIGFRWCVIERLSNTIIRIVCTHAEETKAVACLADRDYEERRPKMRLWRARE